jgi:hypothetical protein
VVIFVHDLGENKLVSVDDDMGMFWVLFVKCLLELDVHECTEY